MDGAVGPFGQRFADGLPGALRGRAERDHFAAMLLFQLQSRFERVRVRLIDLISQVGLFDPLARARDAQLRIARRDLLDGDDNFHN